MNEIHKSHAESLFMNIFAVFCNSINSIVNLILHLMQWQHKYPCNRISENFHNRTYMVILSILSKYNAMPWLKPFNSLPSSSSC